MKNMNSNAQMIGRRGELIAELFLQDIGAEFIARPQADLGYDFFVGFQNSKGGTNTIAVQVKATGQPLMRHFEMDKRSFDRLAHSNLPILLLVTDVKQNRLSYAWITPDIVTGKRSSGSVRIAITEVDDSSKNELRRQLAGALPELVGSGR
jgi:hypothetical protein